MPGFAVGGVGSVLRSARLADFSPEQLGFLTYGRGVDTTRMRERARLRAGVHHRRGLRRLRRAAAADRWPRRAAARRRPRPSCLPGLDEPARRRRRREPTVGDAEIIPIGTRGRPGPRHRQRQPSVGGPRAWRPARRKTARRGPTARRPTSAPAPSRREPTTEQADGRAAAEPRRVGRRRPPSDPRHRTHADDRGTPAGGIPAGDWLAAFQHAAREVFGEQWEPQLARFLAFLRRRVTGDYVVDEYGFDAESPSASSWPRCARSPRSGSASRSAASRTSPPRAAPWSSPTTPAPSRSTA